MTEDVTEKKGKGREAWKTCVCVCVVERDTHREIEEVWIVLKITRVEMARENKRCRYDICSSFLKSSNPILKWRQQSSFKCILWSSSISQKVKQHFFGICILLRHRTREWYWDIHIDTKMHRSVIIWMKVLG